MQCTDAFTQKEANQEIPFGNCIFGGVRLKKKKNVAVITP